MSSVSRQLNISDDDTESVRSDPELGSQFDSMDRSSYHFTDDSSYLDDSFASQGSLLSQESEGCCERQDIEVVTGVFCHPLTDVPAPAWHEWIQPRAARLPPVRKTVRRDSRLLLGSQLPAFSAPNCRSLAPRLRSFAEDMQMRSIGISLCSETWEQKSNKKYQKEVERLLELKGLKMISNPRKYRRGGGVAIVADLSKVTLQPLDIPNPHNLEIVWALARPKIPGPIKQIICFALYSPPRLRKKTKMTDCIVSTLHSLLTSYPDAGIFGGGDPNCYNVGPILAAGIPRLKNIQQLPTLGGKNLDIFLTNLGCFYANPETVPPVSCDDPRRGVPSDHLVPVVYPLTIATMGTETQYSVKTSRPLPDSGVREFGRKLIEEDWSAVREEDSSDLQEAGFQNIVTQLLDNTCPVKTVKLRIQDKPYMTDLLKKLHRQRTREYRKWGKSPKYKRLTEKFDEKLCQAGAKFLEKNVESIMQAKPGQAYKVLKRMGAQPGDNPDDGSFSLPEHVRLGLSAAESADRLAQKFADISQEYPPLVITELPDRIQKILKEGETQNIPYISRDCVKEKLSKADVQKGGVQGDLPTKLIKEFAHELSEPVAQIYRKITKTGKWPKKWRLEQGIALKKVPVPLSEDEIRIISLTPFFSKQYEKVVMEWLLHFISDKLDLSQYGGRRGTSISHYLIDFINFILYNQDLKEPLAVLAAMVDYKKAFNRQNHSILITLLGDMGTPGWLLNIVVGFLLERELILNYRGEKSEKKNMPGGGPQGTVLGMFLFIILINSVGFKQEDRSIGEHVTQATNAHKVIANMHAKYVDDLTVAEAINLRNSLSVEEERNLVRPLNYHQRTEQVIKKEVCQVDKQLKEIEEHALTNEMKINQKKSKIMLFNTSTTNDCQPEMSIDGVILEVVKEMKLLGVIITEDLKWHENTSYISKKAMRLEQTLGIKKVEKHGC